MALASLSVVQWVAAHVVPHEPGVRCWLRSRRVTDDAADDLVQEAYCRIAGMASVSHIDRPDAYLFQVVRNLHLEQLRRQRVVPMTPLTEDIASSIFDDAADPERAAMARLSLARVEELIAGLPDRCRQIFIWKRIEGVSQKVIAMRLGVTESVVENDVMKGLRLILGGLAEQQQKRSNEADNVDERSQRQRA